MNKRTACECADPGCPVHPKQSACGAQAETTLFRIDMQDATGTRFCESCAEDADKSGLYDGDADPGDPDDA